MHFRHLAPGVAIAMALSLGCVSDDDTSATGSGALGKGSFRQTCGAADALCSEGTSDLDLPARVAVGSRIRVAYDGRIPKAPDGTPATMTVVPASPILLATEGNAMRVMAPGFLAILARTELGTVTDFAHLLAAPIGALVVDAPASVRVGEAIVATVTPRDAEGQTLGGSLDYAWQSADSAVAAIDDGSAGNKATIRGVQPGTAIVTVHAGDAFGEVSVTVEAP